MKKYYYVYVGEIPFENREFQIFLKEYYLLPEGWILCEDYRENQFDPYYAKSTWSRRADFCVKRSREIDKRMFSDLNDARIALKTELNSMYRKEINKLEDAFDRAFERLQLKLIIYKKQENDFDE